MFQRELKLLSLIPHTLTAMSSKSPPQRKPDDSDEKGSGEEADTDGAQRSELASRGSDGPSIGCANAETVNSNGHDSSAKQDSGAQTRSPSKKKTEAKPESTSKTKRAKLEKEKAVEPNRVHELLLSCGNAFCGDLTVEQVSLSPTLIPSVRSALEAITAKDIGVTDSDVKDGEPQFVTIHSNTRFSLVIHLLPAKTSMSFLSHKSLISLHRVLHGSIAAREHVIVPPEVSNEKFPEKKKKITCKQGDTAAVHELRVRFSKEDAWAAPSPVSCYTHEDEDTVLELTSTSASVVVQLTASPQSLHLSGARFVLKPRAEEEEEQKYGEGEPGSQKRGLRGEANDGEGGEEAPKQRVKTEGARKEIGGGGGDSVLIAMDGGGSMGHGREYAGTAWGPVAMGTRMAGSRWTL